MQGHEEHEEDTKEHKVDTCGLLGFSKRKELTPFYESLFYLYI